MNKLVFIICTFIMILSASLSAREVVGHNSTTDHYSKKITPSVSFIIPDLDYEIMLISSPDRVISFFQEKGINVKALEAETLPTVLKDELCSICMECCDEFQNVLLDVIAQYVDSGYKTYIVQIADVYWKFSA